MTFEGEFLAPSPFRGAPSPRVDAAWESITAGHIIGATSIPREMLPLLNKTFSDDLYVDPETGEPIALLEVFHQLHCLASAFVSRLTTIFLVSDSGVSLPEHDTASDVAGSLPS